MRKTRRQFSDEFKADAVAMVRDQGQSVAQVARGLDVSESVLRKWIERDAGEQGQTRMNRGVLSPEQQIAQLEQELKQIRKERDILKKSIACFARDLPL